VGRENLLAGSDVPSNARIAEQSDRQGGEHQHAKDGNAYQVRY
jgi:hypothetical protein